MLHKELSLATVVRSADSPWSLVFVSDSSFLFGIGRLRSWNFSVVMDTFLHVRHLTVLFS